MSLADQFWWLAPALTVVTIGLLVWFNYGQHKVRQWRVRKPFDAFFIVPPNERVLDLHVPAHSDVEVQLRLQYHLPHRQDLFIFGFKGYTQKPVPISVLNKYVKKGQRREQSPDTNENHYIDEKDRYHIRESREWTKPNHAAYGFIVRTKEPGRYPVVIQTITDCGEGAPRQQLVLVVDAPAPPRRRLDAPQAASL